VGTRDASRVLECNGCCGTAEGRAVAMLSCAGAYVGGAVGSNECPAGSARIETEAACRTAAAAAGKAFDAVLTDSGQPRGCSFQWSDSRAYFNPHAVGTGHTCCQLLCAAVTTGAPSTRRCATRVLRGTRGRCV
jgi:hypothetical protein